MQLDLNKEIEVPGLIYKIEMTKEFLTCYTYHDEQYRILSCDAGEQLQDCVSPENFVGDKSLPVHEKAMTDSSVYVFKRLSLNYNVLRYKEITTLRCFQTDNTTFFHSEEMNNVVSKYNYDLTEDITFDEWCFDDIERPTAIAIDESGLKYVAAGVKKKSILLLNQQGERQLHPLSNPMGDPYIILSVQSFESLVKNVRLFGITIHMTSNVVL